MLTHRLCKWRVYPEVCAGMQMLVLRGWGGPASLAKYWHTTGSIALENVGMMRKSNFLFLFAIVKVRGSISFCPQPEATAREPLLNLYLSLLLKICPLQTSWSSFSSSWSSLSYSGLFARHYQPTSGVMSNSQYRILLTALTLITFAQLYHHHHHCHQPHPNYHHHYHHNHHQWFCHHL